MSDFFNRFFGRFFGGFFGPGTESTDGSLSGAIQGTSTITGRPAVVAHLSGSVHGTSTVSGTLTDGSVAPPAVDVQRGGSVRVRRRRVEPVPAWCAGTIRGAGALQGTPTTAVHLIGHINGSSTCTGTGVARDTQWDIARVRTGVARIERVKTMKRAA